MARTGLPRGAAGIPGQSQEEGTRAALRAQDEAVRNMQMFAATVLPEIKSWTATSSLDDAFFKLAA